MARKTAGAQARRRRIARSRGFVAIPFEFELSLATLGDGIVTAGAILAANFLEDFYCISIDSYWSLRNADAGEGPLLVGFAHGDLTVTEIKEALEAEMVEPDNIIAKERSRRPVRKSGKFRGLNTEEVLNLGVEIRTKLRFSVGSGHTLDAWLQNRSGAALAGGTTLAADGTLYGRWQR